MRIVSALEVEPDAEKWFYDFGNDNYIKIVIGRSQEYVNTHGELTEEDRTLLANKLNALIDANIAPWRGIRNYLRSNRYYDFDSFMQILRHSGSVDALNSLFPFIYDDLQSYIDKVRASDSESQKQLGELISKLEDFVKETVAINEIETFLQLLETGTDFKTRNITQHLNGRILSFSKRAEAKGLEYIVDLTDEDLFVEYCDLNLLDVVIDNLIQNAIEYTSHGKIVVRVSKKSVEYRTVRGLNAVIEIEDTGIGIPEEEQSKIFERGYRASNVGDIQGTGIGLDATYTNVYTMRGELKLESDIGKGTKITVYLPLLQQESPLKEKVNPNASLTDL